MLTNQIWIILFSTSLAYGLSNKPFPKDFKFGVATASYQVEGAWNEDGKGENIWDRLTHTTNYTVNHDTGDVACDSYHKVKEDVQLLKDLGVNHYRFSLSWSRILPTGFTNKINKAGVKYYNDVINELLENGIEPMVTLFHWDTPQPLQDLGGFPNPLMADYFGEYARTAFLLFGDRVKLWLTFNEPKQTCQQGYNKQKAPALDSPGIGEYLCTHNVIRSHAKAYHIYDKEFRAKQGGKVSIVIDSNWFEAASNSTEDIEAANRMRHFTFGWYANAILNGNYPQVMIERIAKRSAQEGFEKSRLPEFTPEELEYIHGTYDFLGVNSYTSSLVKNVEEAIGDPSWRKDMGGSDFQDPSWEPTASDWLKVTPWGIRNLLKWIKDTYNNPEIIITENGVSDPGTLIDDQRISYYSQYLSALLDAMNEDGVKVTGYTAWSFMDNFEWFSGYSEKFGLYHVDFNSPNRTRTAKKSVDFFKKVIATHCLVEKCE